MIPRAGSFLMARNAGGVSAAEVVGDPICQAATFAAGIAAERLATVEWCVVTADSLRDAAWPEEWSAA